MDQIRIIRLEFSPSGTFGTILVNGQIIGPSLEPPKKGNERNISCIPTGQYFASVYMSEKYDRLCIGLHNVHNRDYIAIHPMNTLSDTKGCIGVGMEVGQISGNRAIKGSNHALDKILGSIGNTCMVTITECL